MSSNKWL